MNAIQIPFPLFLIALTNIFSSILAFFILVTISNNLLIIIATTSLNRFYSKAYSYFTTIFNPNSNLKVQVLGLILRKITCCFSNIPLNFYQF